MNGCGSEASGFGIYDLVDYVMRREHPCSLARFLSSRKLSKHISSSMFSSSWISMILQLPDLHMMNKSRSMVREHSRQKSSFQGYYYSARNEISLDDHFILLTVVSYSENALCLNYDGDAWS